MATKIKTSGKVILILLFIGGLAAAKFLWWDKVHPPKAPEIGNENTTAPGGQTFYLKLAGSNTIGDSLAPALMRAYLESKHATEITEKNAGKDEKQFTATLEGTKIHVSIQAQGTATGFAALDNNTADICMASAPVDDATNQKFSAKSPSEDMRSVSNEHVIGLDGIAVIVNAGNPAASLSLEQVQQIFTGEISNWSSVPGLGKSGQINIYRRDDKSGTYKMFTEMALNKKAIRSDARTFENSVELAAKVAADPDGIGFVSYSFVKGATGIKPVAVSAGAGLMAIVPNPLSIQTERYPLCRRLFLYNLHNATNAHVADFIQFAEGQAGQAIVEASGFVNLSVNNDKPLTAQNDPSEYKNLENTAQKLSIEFRFRFGSSEPDTRAIADINRLVLFLTMAENRKRQVILVGFTDNVGSAAKNVELSKQRAGSIAKLLEQQSITVKEVTGFGSARPVHNNDNEMERSFNRRVEVWLTN